MTDQELDPFAAADWGMLIALALIWGSSFLFIAVGLEHFTPAQVAFVRITLGTAALALVPRARRSVDRADLPRVVLLGLLWVGIPFMLFPIAQQWIDSSLAGMINGGVPLWAALVATLVSRRLPPRGVGIGLVAGFFGIVLIGLPSLDTGGDIAVGAGLVLLATMLYGVALNLAVPLQRRYGALPVMLRAQLAAAVFTLPFAAVGLGQASYGLSSVLAVAALGVLGTGLALTLMATLAGRVGAARGSVAIYLVPIVAIAIGALVRDEAVHPVSLVGTALVIFGAWVTSRSQQATPTTTDDVIAHHDDPAVSAGATGVSSPA